MIDLSYKTNKESIILISMFLVLFILILFPYVRTEILTLVNSDNIKPDEICQNEINNLQINTKISYTKIVKFDSLRESATIYCVYYDRQYNTRLDIEKTGVWKVTISTRLNKDSNFYYPFYI